MQTLKDKTSEAEGYMINNEADNRRKRIKRIKLFIVFVAMLLLIIPTAFCVILAIKVNCLQKQINELVDIHSQYELTYNNADNIAFAAEKDDSTVAWSESSNVLHRVKPTIEPKSESSAGLHNWTNIERTEPSVSVSPIIPTEESLSTGNGNNQNSYKNATIQNQVITEQIDTSQEKIIDTKAGNSSDEKTDDTNTEKGIYTGRKVYLTFDDGPSIYTEDILDILDEYQVKATFFVTGKTDKASKKMYKRIVKDGHTLGMHSYTHQYGKIYNSVEDFDKDFTKLWKLLYDTTGYKPSIYRFPGGSDNLVNKNVMDAFIEYLNNKSVVYFDWNVLNGDATGFEYTKKQLIYNVLSGVANKTNAIVLMHDSQTKETTVEALPELLDKLISGGAEILPLNKNVPPIQMIKADSIK